MLVLTDFKFHVINDYFAFLMQILFVRLTNINGSTVSPPTVVETSIVFAVGNLPSVPRLKQLAQNIRNSSAGNLGLNHTIFGRVKQISLSSFLQHSLSSGSSLPPSPSPQPSVDHHYHHHPHNRRHHGHHSDARAVPSPAPAPKAVFAPVAPPRSGCRFGFSKNPKSEHQIVPIRAPASSPHSPASPSIEVTPALSPYLSPKPHGPSVIFASSRPPSEAARDIKPRNIVPSISPLPSSCKYFLVDLLLYPRICLNIIMKIKLEKNVGVHLVLFKKMKLGI